MGELTVRNVSRFRNAKIGEINVYVCGSICTYRAHCRTPAQSGRARGQYVGYQSNVKREMICHLLRNSSPRQHRYTSSVALGTWRPAGTRGPETIHYFCEDRGDKAVCRSPEAALHPESASRSALALRPRLACLTASTPPRPGAGGV